MKYILDPLVLPRKPGKKARKPILRVAFQKEIQYSFVILHSRSLHLFENQQFDIAVDCISRAKVVEIPVSVTPFPIGSRKRKLTSPEMSAQRSAQAAFKSMRVIKSVEEEGENQELGNFVIDFLQICHTFMQHQK